MRALQEISHVQPLPLLACAGTETARHEGTASDNRF